MKKESTKKSERLMSLDALRGFDMLWISGGHIIIAALAGLTGWGMFEWLEKQMDHTEWNGFQFYDLIFPMFLFISGVTWPMSLNNRLGKGQSKAKIYRHIIQRVVLLVLFGMMYNGFLHFDFENMRYASVLARIGIAWGFGAIIVLHSSPKWWVAWFGGILLSYWAMMALIPVPGFGAGDYSMEGSLVGYIDRLFLPGRLYLTVHDPEGILSTFPAIATALMGAITGNFLMKSDLTFPRMKKFYYLLSAGAIAMFVGWLWGLLFPINKNLWTSSFVLFAGGMSLVFLSLFYLIIDIKGYKRWAFFFVVIGLNSITIYLLQAGIFDFWGTTNYFIGGLAEKIGGGWGELLSAVSYVGVVWLVLYVLYKKKIFLRV
ncbi:MAG: DUF5009 domain-containing protein [Bacteroidales bacterium]|jgi:predicted acyltransferase|nr:DUF5009 domain-containing protein [Bacteroidales bacterium]